MELVNGRMYAGTDKFNFESLLFSAMPLKSTLAKVISLYCILLELRSRKIVELPATSKATTSTTELRSILGTSSSCRLHRVNETSLSFQSSCLANSAAYVNSH